MKHLLFILLIAATSSIACIQGTNKVINSTKDVEIQYLRKNNISYFKSPMTNEAVFIQHHEDEYQATDIKNIEISCDIVHGKKVIVTNKKTGETTLFTTDNELFNQNNYTSSYLVMGIGAMFYNSGNENEDGTLNVSCGCFNTENPPTVNDEPANCANTNPTFSTGCGLSSSTSAGVSILGNGGSGGSSSSCDVACGAGFYACCIEEGTFD